MAIEIRTRQDLDNIRHSNIVSTYIYTHSGIDQYVDIIYGDYIQMANIDLSGGLWEPIGDVWSTAFYYPLVNGSTMFAGRYNGNGYTISNMTVRKNLQGCGLFALAGWGAVFENISLINVDVVGLLYCGGIVGRGAPHLSLTMSRCYVQGSVRATYSHAGMLGGRWDCFPCTISQCAGVGDVSGSPGYYGWDAGLVPNNWGTWDNCYFLGTVSGPGGWCIAGITHSTYYGMNNCYAAAPLNIIGGSNEYPPEKGAITVYTDGAAHGCYFDYQLCPPPGVMWSETSVDVPGKSTIEMKTQSTYTGWDFNTIWGIHPSIQNGYPFLRRIYQNLNNLNWYDGWGGWETSGISWHDYWGNIEWEDIDWELIDWSWNWIPELVHVSITPGQIVPNFDKGQNFYTVSVNRDVKIVKITPWATSPSMNIKINDKITRSGIGVYIPIENHNTEVYIEAPVIIETIIGS